MSLFDQILDRRVLPRSSAIATAAVAFLVVVVGFDHVAHLQEGGAFETDIDKGRLQAGQDGIHLAQVDVTDHTFRLGALDPDLGERAVLDDGNARFVNPLIDEDFGFHAW